VSRFFRETVIVCRKDLLMEFREARHLISVILFALLLLLVASFALSAEPEFLKKGAGGLFWLVVLFSSILTFEHSFQKEVGSGEWQGLLLLGLDPKALFLGKMLTNFLIVLATASVLGPFLVFLYDLSPTASFPLVVFLGCLGLAVLGTLYGGMTVPLRGGQALLPLLYFPMTIPLILAAVHATSLAGIPDLFGGQSVWLRLLILFDVVFFFGSVALSDFVMEGV